MIDRILAGLGIDPRGYRALLRAYATMDLRSQQFGRATASRPEELLTPMVWVVAQYLFIGLAGSALLYGRVDAAFFAAAHLAISTLVIATAVVVEFGEVVLDQADLQVVASRPVTGRTYAAARLTNLLAYALAMSAALGLAPAIVGCALADGGPWFLPAYAAAALAANLAAVAVVVLYYLVVVRGVPSERAREVLAWTQIAAIVVVFYGAQLVFKDRRDRLEMFAMDPPAWWSALPFARLAAGVRSVGPDGDGSELKVVAFAAGGALVAWMVALTALARRCADVDAPAGAHHGPSPPPLPGPGRLVGARTARLLGLGTGAAQAGYGLVARQLSRDSELATRALPTLATLPLLLVLGYAAGQLADPWRGLDLAWNGAPAPDPHGTTIALALVYALALVAPPLLFQLRHSRYHAAAWVLRTAPVADPAALFAGARTAVLVRQVWPMWIATCAILGALWGRWDHAVLHAIAGVLVVEAASAACMLHVFRDMPFAAPLAKGELSGTAALVTSVIGGLAMAVGGVHHVLLGHTWGPALVLVGLSGLAFVLRTRARGALRARFGGSAA